MKILIHTLARLYLLIYRRRHDANCQDYLQTEYPGVYPAPPPEAWIDALEERLAGRSADA